MSAEKPPAKQNSQEDLVREIFTESLDERYAKMTKREKIGYWIFVGVIFAIMAAIGVSTL